MPEIAYQNKDITSKIFAESLREKSLEVYGIYIPKIKRILPTNLPVIEANENHMDNIFELEDDSLAILDYESSYNECDKIKYLNYIARELKKIYPYRKNIKIRMIVLYTADVENVDEILDVGCLRLKIEVGYLLHLNTKSIYTHIYNKLETKKELSDEEIMQLIVLPLTVKGKKQKLLMVEKSVNLAKKINDEKQQVFALAGLLTFSDKIIDADYSNSVKEWIMMTKVARLFEEEKIEAVKKAKEEVTGELTKQMAIKLMNKGVQLETIVEITGLSEEEVKRSVLNYENV